MFIQTSRVTDLIHIISPHLPYKTLVECIPIQFLSRPPSYHNANRSAIGYSPTSTPPTNTLPNLSMPTSVSVNLKPLAKNRSLTASLAAMAALFFSTRRFRSTCAVLFFRTGPYLRCVNTSDPYAVFNIDTTTLEDNIRKHLTGFLCGLQVHLSDKDLDIRDGITVIDLLGSAAPLIKIRRNARFQRVIPQDTFANGHYKGIMDTIFVVNYLYENLYDIEAHCYQNL